MSMLLRCCFEPVELPQVFETVIQKCTDPRCEYIFVCGCDYFWICKMKLQISNNQQPPVLFVINDHLLLLLFIRKSSAFSKPK